MSWHILMTDGRWHLMESECGEWRWMHDRAGKELFPNAW